MIRIEGWKFPEAVRHSTRGLRGQLTLAAAGRRFSL